MFAAGNNFEREALRHFETNIVRGTRSRSKIYNLERPLFFISFDIKQRPLFFISFDLSF